MRNVTTWSGIRTDDGESGWVMDVIGVDRSNALWRGKNDFDGAVIFFYKNLFQCAQQVNTPVHCIYTALHAGF